MTKRRFVADISSSGRAERGAVSDDLEENVTSRGKGRRASGSSVWLRSMRRPKQDMDDGEMVYKMGLSDFQVGLGSTFLHE